MSALNEEHNTVMTRADESESLLSMLKSDLEVEKAAKKQETELLARKVILPIYRILCGLKPQILCGCN